MITIKAQKRDFTLKAKKLRQQGLVPGSVFGGPLEQDVALQLDENTVRRDVLTQRVGSRLKLDVDGEIIPVQIKDKTVDPLNRAVQHISFQALSPEQKVNSVIHLILKNNDLVSGQLEKMTMEIPYASLPGDMIDTLTIDLDGVPSNTVMMVKDIPELQSDKLELQIAPDEIVLRISDR